MKGKRISVLWIIAFILAFGISSAIVLPARAAAAPSPCNCVIFRIDDIQDFNYPNSVVAAMDQFIAKNQSLNPALVMNHIGSNPTIVNEIDNGYKKGLFELQGHGWNHVYFNGSSLSQQTTWLSSMDSKLQDMFGRKTNTFAPPYGTYDSNTLTAMKQAGIKIMSSESQIEAGYGNPIFHADGSNITDNFGIYHLPTTAKFFDYSTGIGVKVPVSEVLSNISSSIAQYGYAVMVMHPPDFGAVVNGKKTDTVDQNQINDLNTIINTELSLNRPITTFSKVVGFSPQPLHDVHPPTITPPPDIAVVANGTLTQVSLGTPTVSDMVDPSPVVTNNAPSAGFPLGTTNVTWTATDSSGNSANATQYVTVSTKADTTRPSISISSPANGATIFGPSSGVTVNVTGTSSDVGSGVKVVQSRTNVTSYTTAIPTGSNGGWSTWKSGFTITKSGVYIISSKATDYWGNVKSTSITVTVKLRVSSADSTTLTLNKIANLPWGKTVTVSGTLTDNNASGVGIGGKTITFTGTGAANLPNAVTISNGTFVSTGTAASTVATWQVQAHYGGDGTNYRASESLILSYNTLKHVVNLVTTTVNTPWSRPISFTATLTDSSNGGTPISGQTLHFNGTGVIGVPSDPTTNSNGSAVATGTSPSSVATGWTYQSHYAGSSLYNTKDSIIKTYSTTKHNTGLSLTVSPSSVGPGNTYKVFGALTDTSASTSLGGKTISFTATSPIKISSQTTASNGNYTVSGLTAPKTTGSYTITAKFAGDTLYNAQSSSAQTLTVSSIATANFATSAKLQSSSASNTVPGNTTNNTSKAITTNNNNNNHVTAWISPSITFKGSTGIANSTLSHSAVPHSSSLSISKILKTGGGIDILNSSAVQALKIIPAINGQNLASTDKTITAAPLSPISNSQLAKSSLTNVSAGYPYPYSYQNQPPIVNQAPITNQPPIVNQAPITNQPPIVNQAPLTNQPPIVNQAPLTNQPPIVNQAPITNQPPIVNQAPIADAGPNQAVVQGSLVMLDGGASHSMIINNGNIAAYQWTQLPIGVPVALFGANTATPTFTAPIIPGEDTLLAFSLRVTDNHGSVSTNPAFVYVMIKHSSTTATTSRSNTEGQMISQGQTQGVTPSNIIGAGSWPNSPGSQIPSRNTLNAFHLK